MNGEEQRETRTLPASGLAREALFAEMAALADHDADWRHARTWSLVYHASVEVEEVVKEAYTRFMAENGLSPVAFPSLHRFEREVVGMASGMLHAPDTAAGNLTSGGTESLFLAVKSARDWARAHRPEVRAPEMLLPVTAHPALLKAAHYLDVKPVPFGIGPDFRADVGDAARLASASTILVVASAPAFPHGVVDPVSDLAALARERGALCHVDSCIGGFMLPWAERLGRAVPPFDFRVPGVTSMSVDVHKYGYGAKGTSLVLYRNKALRRHQFFAHTDWPGGMYASPTAAGTRPGGAIAAAWAVMNFLGEEGYLRLARQTLEATDRLIAGIGAIGGLRVLGRPDMTIFAFTSDDRDIFAVGSAMERRGWRMDRQHLPDSLHLVVTANHAPVVDAFLADLAAAAAEVGPGGAAPSSQGAFYGMLGQAPDAASAREFLFDLLER